MTTKFKRPTVELTRLLEFAIATPAWNNPDFNVALPSDGLYTLVIEGDTSSPLNYRFTVADTTVAPIPHTGFNTPVTAAIATAGAVQRTILDADGNG